MKRLVMIILLIALTGFISACSGRIVTSGNYTLRSGETLNGDLTMTSGNAVLEAGSRVTGSILMTSGDLEIDGEVEGDVVMTSGDINLGADAYVHGDITTTSGDFRRAEGARVDGDIFTEDTGFNGNVITNIIGRILILPIIIIVFVFYFIVRPGQQRQEVAKRSGATDESFEEEATQIFGGEFMNNQTNRVTSALVLIGLGVVFLLAQTGLLSLSGNWWAIFIALPAVVMLYNAYSSYQKAGEVTGEVRRNISGGAIIGTVAIIALTGQWGTLWPLFLIVPGVMMLLGFNKQNDQA